MSTACRSGPATMAAWRARIAAVMQDDYLLTGTLAENIAFFDPLPGPAARSSMSARLARIHEDIVKMPMAYHSLISDMGAALSSRPAPAHPARPRALSRSRRPVPRRGHRQSRPGDRGADRGDDRRPGDTRVVDRAPPGAGRAGPTSSSMSRAERSERSSIPSARISGPRHERDPALRLNPEFDTAALAAAYRETGRIRIQRLLADGAPELYYYLEGAEHWIQVLNKEEGAHELALDDLGGARLSPPPGRLSAKSTSGPATVSSTATPLCACRKMGRPPATRCSKPSRS